MDPEVAGVREWYNLTAASFSQRYEGIGGLFWKIFEETLALELLGQPGPRLLDLGCGPGRLVEGLSGVAECVVGVDISEAMIQIAQSRPHPRNVHYAIVDATRAAFASGTFEAIISLGMFEYLSDPGPFLCEILRLLRPGGRLIFTCHSQAGERFLWWWTLPARAWRKTRRRLLPDRGAAAVDPTYGQPVEIRDRLFSKVLHRPQELRRVLEGQGFHSVSYRGFLFPPSVSLFNLASRLPTRSSMQAGVEAAQRLDRQLGRSSTRNLTTLAMFTAHKPV